MRFEDFSPLLEAILEQNKLSHLLAEGVTARFHALTERMLEVNKSMNLTAITDEAAVALLHYADSLTVARFLPEGARLCDVGCGAGFPCLPLAIVRPDLSILALDSTEKRIRYVSETARLLGCEQLEATAARAEEAGKGALRESFDVVTARAVASLPMLAELCLPLVRPGGVFLAMKAKKGEEETEQASTAIKRLGGEIVALHDVTLRHGEREETRVIVEVAKRKHTPAEFPRAWAKILKKPL